MAYNVTQLTQASGLDQGAFEWVNNLRIVSITIFGYEYVVPLRLVGSQHIYSPSYFITIPAELRLYKTASRRR
jgi:hypothetical protein